jgi:hypothetical protein
VEIQLRTVRQQDWAESVERLDKSHGLDLKHEQGPDDFWRSSVSLRIITVSVIVVWHTPIGTCPDFTMLEWQLKRGWRGGLSMRDRNIWFLLVQHVFEGTTDVTEFDDSAAAAAEYGAAERRYAEEIHSGDMDVLLVGASSLDVVKQRYPSYFMNPESTSTIIRDLLADLANS